jgi:hypothetical protein
VDDVNSAERVMTMKQFTWRCERQHRYIVDIGHHMVFYRYYLQKPCCHCSIQCLYQCHNLQAAATHTYGRNYAPDNVNIDGERRVCANLREEGPGDGTIDAWYNTALSYEMLQEPSYGEKSNAHHCPPT